MAHEFGVRLAQIAFATTAVQSALARSDFTSAVQLALLATGVFYALGLICGETARRIVDEHVARQPSLINADSEPKSAAA